jgi:hypothetical protein
MLSIPGLVAAAAFGDGPQAPLVWLQVLAWSGYLINLGLTYLATLGYARAALGPRS